MRVRLLLTAPRWALSLVTGVVFGTGIGVFAALYEHGGWVRGLVVGVLAGGVFGAVMGPFAAAQARQAREMMGPLGLEDQVAVLRAASRGPVPADRALREAAAGIVEHRLAMATRHRRPLAILFGAFLLLGVVAAVLGSSWLWAGVVLYAAGLGLALANPVWLRRRRDLLRAVP